MAVVWGQRIEYVMEKTDDDKIRLFNVPQPGPSPFLGSLSFAFFLMRISLLIFAFTFYLEGDTYSKKTTSTKIIYS
nr:hypothetical protein CFP56_38241 [Quercus suber]